jgi:hypothetical protein
MTQNKQPSQELLNYLIELKTSIAKLKDLYKIIDKKAIEEGFSIDEIYEIANITDIPQKSIETATTTTSNNQSITNTTTNSNNNEETKYFQRYFQHFQ